MKRCILLLMLVSLWPVLRTGAYEKRDYLRHAADSATVCASVLTDFSWIPYPSYEDRTGWKAFMGEAWEDCIRQGEKYLDFSWRPVKATDYLEFRRSGNRQVMQEPFEADVKALSALFLAEMAEGRGRFVDQLANGVFFFCEMTTWSLSAHLSLQKKGWSLPSHEEHIIDLGAGNLASTLAWIHYYLKQALDRVDPMVASRLRHELQERILDTYMENDRFWWMAFHLKKNGFVNNWNPWCNSNVLQCFMLLETDPARLGAAVWRSMCSVDQYINYVQEDGACEEGSTYWGHGPGKLYDYLQLLHDITGGRVSIFDRPLIRHMGEYIARMYVGKGWAVNFADASARGGGDSGLVFRYGKAVGSPLMQSYARSICKPGRRLPKGDVFRFFQTLLYRREMEAFKGEFHQPASSWYPGTEVCCMSSREGLFLAAKGGYNDESHNHNDVGSFCLYLNSTPLFIDAGPGTYTRQTFGPERYSLWNMQSDYHNLPMINGVSQKHGRRYRARDVHYDSRRRTFSADLAGAYPEEAGVKSWVRTYRLDGRELEIREEYSLSRADGPTCIRFMCWGKTDVSLPGRVTLEVQGQRACLLYDSRKFVAEVETVVLDDPRFVKVWGPEIRRISLRALRKDLVGTHRFRVKAL